MTEGFKAPGRVVGSKTKEGNLDYKWTEERARRLKRKSGNSQLEKAWEGRGWGLVGGWVRSEECDSVS